MKLIQCLYSSGQRVPLLVQTGDAAPLPILVPLIYVQFKLSHRAYNTAAAHLLEIQAFYSYAKRRGLGIDEAIMACHFEAILALLDGYAIWLQSGRQADNLVARIGKAETAPFPHIDSRIRDQYLRLLKQYLSWCVTRYIPCARQNSTTPANIEIVPGAAENPFPERLQLRNWLMIEVLLETDIRRGELLKFYTTDINQGSQHAYLCINDREHDPGSSGKAFAQYFTNSASLCDLRWVLLSSHRLLP